MTAIDGAVHTVPPDIRIEPPGAGPFSMTNTRAPAALADTAAQRPAMPAPHTTTSARAWIISPPARCPDRLRGLGRLVHRVAQPGRRRWIAGIEPVARARLADGGRRADQLVAERA